MIEQVPFDDLPIGTRFMRVSSHPFCVYEKINLREARHVSPDMIECGHFLETISMQGMMVGVDPFIMAITTL